MKAYVIFFLLIPSFGYSQNLVPNPSFEEYDECPVGTAELNIQTNWVSWQETPDYFNACNNEITGWAGVPYNSWGFQPAISGFAYSALVTFVDNDINVREYMATQLLQPLVIGQEYYISFYASQIEGETGTYPMEYRCATNHIGLRFFKDPSFNNVNNEFQPDNFAHVDYGSILSDTEEWTKIEGWFVADDSYNWVAIGNFFDGANTEIEIQNKFGNCSAAYFIENICVSPEETDCDYLQSNIEALKAPSIQVFPNPFYESISLISEGMNIRSVEIYNSWGRLYFTGALNEKILELNTADWPNGPYLLAIKYESSSIQTIKILKQ